MYTILLVEDDAALRDGLTELFTREGYSVPLQPMLRRLDRTSLSILT